MALHVAVDTWMVHEAMQRRVEHVNDDDEQQPERDWAVLQNAARLAAAATYGANQSTRARCCVKKNSMPQLITR